MIAVWPLRRWLVRLGVVAAGFALGAGTLLALQQPVQPDAAPARGTAPGTPGTGTPGTPGSTVGSTPGTAGTATSDTRPAPTATAESEALAKPAPVPKPQERLLLAWTSGGLPQRFAEGIAALPQVKRLSVIRGGLLELEASRDADGRPVDVLDAGWVIPLDAVGVDPATYPPFVAKSETPAISELDEAEALLSATGARLRGLGPGARLSLRDGPEVTVAAVVDDAMVGGAEIALHTDVAAATAAGTPRYVLLAYSGDRAELEQAIRGLLPGGPAVRLRGPGETPILRHGDAVLTQAQVKERFGEFSYRRLEGRDVEQDPAWVASNIETATVPLLGRVRCHRAVLPAFEAALAELEREHLGHTVEPGGYAGCHVGRLTSSGHTVSRHAWGIAFDVNIHDNPVGRASSQDPRLVTTLERWGFTWGGPWLVPDPAHFEFVRPPPPGLLDE